MLARLNDIRARMPAEYLQDLVDRRVVLVGPAASLSGRGCGAWIDAHDVVVRMNLSSPVLAGNVPDVGSRTDVLYHRLFDARLAKAAGQDHTPEQIAAWRSDGVRWIITNQRWRHDRVKRFLPILDQQIPFVTMDETMPLIRKLCGCTSPSLGTIAIVHLLAAGIGQLDVTGIDFYQSAYYVGYGGFTAEQAARGNGQTLWGQCEVERNRARVPHPQEPQSQFLRRLSDTEPRLVFDKVAMAALDQL